MAKRASQRISAELQVFYGPDQKTVLSGFSADFSVGGLFIKTAYPFKVDEGLTVMFSVPGHAERAVACKARVAWINSVNQPCKPGFPPGIGVHFMDIAPEDLASISSFLDLEKAEK